jgi:hypothetical protein
VLINHVLVGLIIPSAFEIWIVATILVFLKLVVAMISSLLIHRDFVPVLSQSICQDNITMVIAEINTSSGFKIEVRLQLN